MQRGCIVIAQLQRIPTAGTLIEIQTCGLVRMVMDGQEICFWLDNASPRELMNLSLFLRSEILDRLSDDRVIIFEYLKIINGELDARVNAMACMGRY